MAFNTSAQILQDIADSLKVGAVANLQPYYTNYAAEWQSQAFNDIVGILTGRKYTLAQVLAADNGPFWERSLTRWYIFSQPQTQGHFDPELIKLWDVRPVLRTVSIITAGVTVYPLGSAQDPQPGEVGVGPMADDANTIFPSDIRRIRW